VGICALTSVDKSNLQWAKSLGLSIPTLTKTKTSLKRGGEIPQVQQQATATALAEQQPRVQQQPQPNVQYQAQPNMQYQQPYDHQPTQTIRFEQDYWGKYGSFGQGLQGISIYLAVCAGGE
jgi:hypothetical protein